MPKIGHMAIKRGGHGEKGGLPEPYAHLTETNLESVFAYQARALAKLFERAALKGPLHTQALTAALIETAKQYVEMANATEARVDGPEPAP